MPISIHYDPGQNVLHSKATGVISFKDIMAYYSKIERLDLKPGYSVLADYTEGSTDLKYNDIARMVEKRRSISLKSGMLKIAVVAKSDVVFGMARMYQAIIGEEHFEVNVFRDRGEALRWLGISDLS
ncbi:MAG: STAS/SEC14 domain-containing protein [Desulfobacteraceae bacterium]|uniref:STAS/SEC14 domain-containing protein n=1 Tax=Candidatus Desulfaltia bathyphila TaxID=2841697 RepID=A0A8J6N4R0_9BACT|nr:STAS/SEC14 domain-containing protein [Candidatus Desulfaltia bathyphila]MBL7196390.1 STAS/SEC14 domain-containing protein [Desulfobacterales bacterium]